jgi:hypothetical protein
VGRPRCAPRCQRGVCPAPVGRRLPAGDPAILRLKHSPALEGAPLGAQGWRGGQCASRREGSASAGCSCSTPHVERHGRSSVGDSAPYSSPGARSDSAREAVARMRHQRGVHQCTGSRVTALAGTAPLAPSLYCLPGCCSLSLNRHSSSFPSPSHHSSSYHASNTTLAGGDCLPVRSPRPQPFPHPMKLSGIPNLRLIAHRP